MFRVWKWLVAVAVLAIALVVFVRTVESSPGGGVLDSLPPVWKHALSLLLFAVPAYMLLLCPYAETMRRKVRGAAAVMLFLALCAVGWKFPGACSLARYYANPTKDELCLQLADSHDVVYNETTEEKVVALTFDDGPTEGKTDAILDVLRDEGVHATFFIRGSCIAGNEKAIEREYREGHEIGNHSWSHRHLAFCLPSQIKEEFERTGLAIAAITGRKPVLGRPPFGSIINVMGVKCMRDCGLTPVLWNTSSVDWRQDGDENILERVCAEQPHTAIALHHDHSSSPHVVRETIQSFRQRGYRFVTVSELMRLADKQGHGSAK